MSQKTILVIDDSATIRRLVDGHLSQAGYRVALAAGAQEGLQLAEEQRPDLILLDHQLPGTTGYEVCQQLLESSELRQTPVVVSSTLRKRAYAEYTDLPNVVDMLPKPYTEELLETTVGNALDTGSLVVQSQTEGTAVPEVIHDQSDSDLSGSLAAFGLREIIDFVNNGVKCGVLEVEAERRRVSVYVAKGRIQAVAATGVDPGEIADCLPDSLRDLRPVVNLTVGGRSCSEIDGLVELLDNKVLDPRLLRQLLRHQAAMLIRQCFREPLKGFRFEAERLPPPLFRRLPLEISLPALLVEGALRCDASQLQPESPDSVYLRRSVRGQNLDRAGLSARHMKAVGTLSQPLSSAELAEQLGWEAEEARRVLDGLVMADLVEVQSKSQMRQVVILETDAALAQQLRDELGQTVGGYAGKVVRDRLALQLVLKRNRPDALVLPLDTDETRQLAEELMRSSAVRAEGGSDVEEGQVAGAAGSAPPAAHVKWVGTFAETQTEHREALRRWHDQLPAEFDAFLKRPYDAAHLVEKLDELFEANGRMDGQNRQPEEVPQAVTV